MSDNGKHITPPRAFEIRVEGVDGADGVAVIAIEGEADLAAAREFRRCVDKARERGAASLVVDGVDLAFMDSSMLKELLRARSELGTVVLAGLSGGPRRLLTLTRTETLFTLAGDRADALKIARGG